ncbi:MAG TPA: glutamine--fructose-6-phosphate transaminase (isomerizing) [Rickettsiales bacterium]|nr:glutamine--fructose-6-phosphate transaminase (isomerizing) [Rickettsiales bacterium]
MCGIVGAVGQNDIIEKIVEGLRKLEYRGYDSAGVAVLDAGIFKTVKQEGKIAKLEAAVKKSELKKIDKNSQNKVAIGHTRWATHGKPSEENAHPHASSKICVVHNGIIENYQELKENLQKKGSVFLSETDSEIVPHLLEENLAQSGDKKLAVMKTLSQINGSYALAIMFRDNPDVIAIAKKGSPLLVGIGVGENYIASDYYALSKYTKEVVYLEDDQFAFVYKDKIEFFNKKGEQINREIKIMENLENRVSKGNFAHFMLKEIYEQPQVLQDTIQTYVDLQNSQIHLPNFSFDLKSINKITAIACGTSYYAAMQAKYLFEEIVGIEVEVDIASEFRYRHHPFRQDNLMIFISQSGETADTIAALKYAKENNQKILSIVNVAQSSMAQLSDVVIKTVAGIEIGVASTKAYTAQLSVLALLAIKFGEVRGFVNREKQVNYLAQIVDASKKIAEILEEKNVENIQKTAKYLTKTKHILYIGRGVSYVSALEAALKLRELSYIDAQAIAAGELKHGTIALIDAKMPVIAIAPSNNLFEKIASNIEEIRARGGKIVIVSDKKGVENMKNLLQRVIEIPQTNGAIEEALVTIIPLQLLAYYVALYKGNDVDQPRNLAKSVTVE